MTIESILGAVLVLIVVGIVFYLLNWLIDYVALPPPFAKVAKVLLAVLAVFLIIAVLLGLIGKPLIRW